MQCTALQGVPRCGRCCSCLACIGPSSATGRASNSCGDSALITATNLSVESQVEMRFGHAHDLENPLCFILVRVPMDHVVLHR
jgi:hypothetical protein